MIEKRELDGVRSTQSSRKVLRRLLSAAAVLFVLCLVFMAPASAAEYYVSPNGLGYEATLENPSNLTTVLVNLIKPGSDTEYVVYLTEGEYTNDYLIDKSTNYKVSVTLKPYNNADVKIKGKITIKNLRTVHSATYPGKVTLENLTFTHSNSNYAIYLYDGTSYPGDLVINNCLFSDCKGGINVPSGNARLTSLKILNTTFTNLSTYQALYGKLSYATDVRVEGCTITQSPYGLGIRTLPSASPHQVTIRDNIISTEGYCILLGQSNTKITNVTICDNYIETNSTGNGAIVSHSVNTLKGLFVQNNVLKGPVLLNLNRATDTTAEININNNYWNGENPLGIDVLTQSSSPLIYWGNSVPPQSIFPFYFALDGNEIDKNSLYSGSTYLINIVGDDSEFIKPEKIEYNGYDVTHLQYGYPAGSTVTLNTDVVGKIGQTAEFMVTEETSGTLVNVDGKNTFVMPANNVTVNVQWTINKYTITWQNDDGSFIDTTTVEYGTVPTHADATKADDAQYTYSFAGWSPEVVAVTGDATYNATYTATKNSYIITWQNDDGSFIDTTTVEYGTVPTHADATKAADAQYTYSFAGWSPEVVAVTGDATYNATYTSAKNSYTITWQNDDGSLIDTTTVEYGAIPTHADATKAADAQYTYSFAGWSPEVVSVTSDATYNATYTSAKNSYTITWQNDDGSLIDTTTVEYGTVPTHADATKADDAQYTYTFAGWTPEIVAVTGDATYTASYSSAVKKNEAGNSNSFPSIPSPNYKIHVALVDENGEANFLTHTIIYHITMPEGYNGKIEILDRASTEALSDMDVYHQADISLNFTLKEGDKAIIHFKIPTSTLDEKGLGPEDACLYHYDEVTGWTKLTTWYTVVGDTVIYDAEADAFSPFAIVFEENSAKLKGSEPVTPPTEEPTEEPKTPFPVFGILAGLGATAVLRRK